LMVLCTVSPTTMLKGYYNGKSPANYDWCHSLLRSLCLSNSATYAVNRRILMNKWVVLFRLFSFMNLICAYGNYMEGDLLAFFISIGYAVVMGAFAYVETKNVEDITYDTDAESYRS
jgi:hypothetical protein